MLAQCSMGGDTFCCSGLPAQVSLHDDSSSHGACACASPVMCPFLLFAENYLDSVCSPGRVKGNKVVSLECFEGAGVEHKIKKYSSRLA